LFQVDLKKVVDHVCDTAGHLLKPRVTLEKMVDQTTPSIAGDGSRIVQACTGSALYLRFRVLLMTQQMTSMMPALSKLLPMTVSIAMFLSLHRTPLTNMMQQQ